MYNWIKEFCAKNSQGHGTINFNEIRKPNETYIKFGSGKPMSEFKGLIFEQLLLELFRGNGYLVDYTGQHGHDEGCDLLIKQPSDNSIFMVVQAKNHNTNINTEIIDAELGKFSRSYKKKYNLKNSQFCLIAWKYTKNLKNTITKELSINVWDEEDMVENLFSTYKKEYPKHPTVELLNYQKTAFKRILKFWYKKKRCYVEHATGTGKSYIIIKLALHILEVNKDNKVLIVVPSNIIKNEILNKLSNYISSHLISLKPNNKVNINILTYQYIYHNAVKRQLDYYTHIIFDEAHHISAPKWYKYGINIISKRQIKIVGFSATFDYNSKDIDVINFFDNNKAGELSLFSAINQEIIPNIGQYVYAIQDPNTYINDLRKEGEIKFKSNKKLHNKFLKSFNSKQIKEYSLYNIINKYYSNFNFKKILVFCESIDHLIEIRKILDQSFRKFSTCNIYEISSFQSRAKNNQNLENFLLQTSSIKQIDIILSIDMLNEGIDIKDIDSIMLFRKTKSSRIYLQQLGRVLRHNSKKDPLIFDCVRNFENVRTKILSDSTYSKKHYVAFINNLGLSNLEVPKSVVVYDETKGIYEIVKEIENKLHFYREYAEAKCAVKNLEITSESEYKKVYKEDPSLPSKPHIFYKNKGWLNWYHFLDKEEPELYETYEEARTATIRLKIKTTKGYKARYVEDNKLPSTPDRKYKNKGWTNWSDYFGISRIKKYQNIEDAKKAIKTLNINNLSDYKLNYNQDKRLPSKPHIFYLNNGWIDYYDFFGLPKNEKYKTLLKAKLAVKKLNIKSERQYKKRFKEDPKLPQDPSKYYKNKGWIDYYEFFEKPTQNFYKNYEEAKKAVEKLSINSREEYKKRYKQDPSLPSAPDKYYKNNGWKSFSEFVGNPKNIIYFSYEEAREVVSRLGIKSRDEYVNQKKFKKESKLPSQPDKYYKGRGWINWNHFIRTKYLTYEEAKQAAKKVGIKSRKEYITQKQYKKDPLLPSNPEKTYKNKGWKNWPFFFDLKKNEVYELYLDAKASAKKLGIKSMKEYFQKRHLDSMLPRNPSECYKGKGWINSDSFFDINQPEFYETYEEAKKAVERLNINSWHEYRTKKKYKSDPRLPSSPEKFYQNKGWVNWNTFFGKPNLDIYQSYDDAKKAVYKLDFKTGQEYKKKYKLDPRLPSTPSSYYKDKGWSGFEDFLGKSKKRIYNTYTEAEKAVKKLKIKSRKEYYEKKAYSLDKLLPHHPERKYKDKGWISWKIFLGVPKNKKY